MADSDDDLRGAQLTLERWKEIDGLLQAALDHKAEDRSAFLDRACAHDDELRREVASLLYYESASDFLEQSPFAGSTLMAEKDQDQFLEGSALGRYRIERLVGAGGMGEVYLAQDTELDRTVALKVLPVEVAEDHERMRRFIQEAKSLSALNHPNIITIHEIARFDQRYFIAIEYVKGQTLRERLKRKSLSVAETLEIAVQIASALSVAHDAGIVHRDIKPENIMVRNDGLVKVLDFGLVKLIPKPYEHRDSDASTRIQVRTEPGMILGTVVYMSPEQACGKSVDERSDIFSLGVVCYEMLTGRLPFSGETTSEVLAAILKEEPLPLAEYVSQVPEGLEGIVKQCLRKNREERYQHIRDLLTELKELKQELEFAEKLGASAGATKDEKATANDGIARTQIGRATAASESFVSEIKPHQGWVVAALACLLLAAIGIGYWVYSSRTAATGLNQIESIVVLPFQNANSDADSDYLSDGISEALINSLTELKRLKVIARTTAFRYKDRDVDPQTVGRELNVRAVLLGRVRQTGDNLNVKVDLVDVGTGAQLWGNEYDRKLIDILAVKQTIVREVTENLRLRLSADEQRQIVKLDATNVEAYQHYLRGRHFWNKRNAEGLKRAIREFQQAIDLDPAYALGYVGLADCYLVMETVANAPAAENLAKARAAADRALQIDDSLAEAHASSAMVYEQMWRWMEAEQEFKRAISLNPNYSTAHHWFSHYYRANRRFDDAMQEIKRAQELDPLSPPINFNLAQVYLLKGDIKAAIEQSEKVTEIEPNFARNVLAFAYLKQQDYEKALAEFQRDVDVFKRESQDLASLGYAYAVLGQRTEALRILKEIEERYARGEALGQYMAAVYTGLKEEDQAFAWLEKDFQQRSGSLTFVTWFFAFEPLRSDPRYANLVRRMGLEP